jgi:glycosyltransferase involved in cell wall biosynthesis
MVGVPAIEAPSWWFVLAMQGIAYPPNWTKQNQIVWGREVGDARNHIVEQAIKANAEYLLFLDDDTMPPPNLFIKLLSLKKDIASGLYCTKTLPSYPLIFEREGEGCFGDWKLGDLVRVWGCGMGATLINMRVFTEGKIEKPYFKTERLAAYKDPETQGWYYRSGTEDLYFLDKAMHAGYETYVDTSLHCYHFDRNSGMMYPFGTFEEWYERGDWRT